MPLIIEWPGGNRLIQETQSLLVGRDESVDVRVRYRRVSRQHLLIQWESDKWHLRDLSTANGTFKDGQPVDEVVVESAIELNLGGKDGPLIKFAHVGTVADTGSLEVKNLDTSRVALGTRTRLGRDPSSDIPLADFDVSRVHCEILTRDGQTHQIVDLGSANGTFVNGEAVKRASLRPGDEIRVGSETFTYTGSALDRETAGESASLEANGLGFRVGDATIIRDVSFELKPNSLTALLGPSGAGKSTLLNMLTGATTPTEGEVRFGGMVLHENFETLRTRLGYVPQQDLIHSSLTVRKALEFGADLRFTSATSSADKKKRIEEVIAELGLTQHAEKRISQLSGGQRKRASVALELLTEPLLLFLDEPTSGLDPGLDRQVMALLRDLAEAGRTVVVVTHSTANLDLCDDVLVMAPGGSVAYFGSPLTVLQGLDSADWSEAFDKLEAKAIRPANRHTRETPIQHRADIRPLPRQNWFYQFGVLAKRYVAVIAADRAYLAFLLALPVLLAVVGLVAGNSDGLGPGPDDVGGLNIEARSLLLIIILGAAFMGSAVSIQELVKERPIYEREKNTGLSPSAYVASKILVLGLLVMGQTVIFTTITLSDRPLPDSGVQFESPLLDLLLPVTLLALTSMLIGLWVSAFANSTDVALPALVLITVVQVVLSGAVPLRFDEIAETLGLIDPSYWAMNMMAGTVDLNSLVGYVDDDVVSTWEQAQSTWRESLYALSAYGTLLAVALIGAARQLKKGS